MTGDTPPMNRPADTLSLVLDTFARNGARRVLDVGCGGGTLSAALASRGYDVTGIDPSEDALQRARGAAPSANFRQAAAEALPFEANSFDGAVFVNSLHHVPEPAMQSAITEALRVVGNGPVIVVEPLAAGPFFETMRPIEDETRIRAAAAETVEALSERGFLTIEQTTLYERNQTFKDVQAFIDYLATVNPSRLAAVDRQRALVEDLFTRHAVAATGGFQLMQPLRFQLLRSATGAH